MGHAAALPRAPLSQDEALPFGRRQKRARGSRMPVTVVTGFLGSGKTTLIRRFLDTEAGRGTAIIVNEFGETGIDDALLRTGAEATTLLGNGCLCCTMRSDLEITLRELLADAATGRVPSFHRVLIETSGLAEPGPILQTFAADPGIAREFHVETVLTVVDALNGSETIATMPEARRQVALADRLILTKTDIADPCALQKSLRGLNPFAEQVEARHGEAQADIWSAARIPGVATAPKATHEHAPDVSSFVLPVDRPVDWKKLAAALDLLVQLRGEDILRIKGILAVEGCRGPVLVQGVQHVIHAPVELETWPETAGEGGRRQGRLVFIARGEMRDRIAAVLASVLAL